MSEAQTETKPRVEKCNVETKYFILPSDHASPLSWSMVNQVVIKYCSVSYFKGAHHGNGLKVCCISQKDFHILF